jgi:hypothetical protein
MASGAGKNFGSSVGLRLVRDEQGEDAQSRANWSTSTAFGTRVANHCTA